jgi:hypothetical protein
MRLTVRKLKTIEQVFVGAAGVFNDPEMGVIQKKTPHAAHAGFFIFYSFLKQALNGRSIK